MSALFFAIVTVVAMGQARAVEICPASASGFSLVDARSSTYAFILRAETPREVNGDVAVSTDHGWYRVTVPTVPLTAVPKGLAHSPVLYARFPQTVNITNDWLESAHADVEDWASAGMFKCYPPAAYIKPWDAGISLAPSASATILSAQEVSPIENTDCAVPFDNARVTRQAEITYPEGFGRPQGTATIVVTVMPDGTAADASIETSSGSSMLDNAAADGALRSTYAPTIAYCRPTVGQYLFKVTFRTKP